MARIAGDKRYYEWVLRGADGELREDNTIQLPSVTTIIKDTLASPAITRWMYDVTIDSVHMVLDMLPQDMTIEELQDNDFGELIKESKLHPDDIRDDAAGRGTDAHSFLEYLSELPREESIEVALDTAKHSTDPFRHAVADWWQVNKPYVVASERLLRSLEHGFAGTVDLVWTPLRRGEPIVTDLKSRKANSRMYRDDEAQTAAYQIAWNEMYPENRARQRSVLLAMDDGRFAYHTAKAPLEVFLSILHLYNDLHS